MGTPMWGLPTERRKPRAEGRGPLEDVDVDAVEEAESVAEEDDEVEAEVAAGAEAGFTGVGTTVCSGLGSGRPPGYESWKMSSCGPSRKLYRSL